VKKRLAIALSLVVILVSLAACGEKNAPASNQQSQETTNREPEQAPGQEPTQKPARDPAPEPEPVKLPEGDSFWTAYEYSVEGERIPLPNEEWWADLTLWADGTARMRQVEDDLIICNEHDLRMIWTQGDDGSVVFQSVYTGDEPCYAGKLTEDGLELTGGGGTFYLKEAPMPATAGELYCPAELRGVWLEVAYEIEGFRDNTMPDNFVSLVIDAEWDEAEQKELLKADSEYYDYNGFVDGAAYCDYPIEVLDEPVYETCGNEVWSVRIGPESPLTEDGYPQDMELYATLLDRDTVLLQRYFTIDGGPGVSYQTYRRMVPYAAGRQMEDGEMAESSWVCTGYRDAEGNDLPAPPDLADFRLYLSGNDDFVYTCEHGAGGGQWTLGVGNTLLLRGLEPPEHCFGGAVGLRKTVSGGSESEKPELYLWYDGGIMLLERAENGDEWSDYADTMNDIEGNAFAAPENALMVLYNQDFGDFGTLHSLPIYEISDSPEAQYVLVTSVLDGTYFWLDEDGFCREDFGTVDAGESFVIRLDVPDSGGLLLQIESALGDYYYELNRSKLAFYENWNYITT